MMNDKFDKKYHYVYNQSKEDYKTEGYKLDWIDEIYLPFWVCKQEIVVQVEMKADEFSEILLGLVANGVKKHTDICVFLGIDEDDFTLCQLDFLISHGFLEENHDQENHLYYEMTHEGSNFLQGKKIEEQKIENTEFEYIINDLDYLTQQKYITFYSDLNKEFFDKENTINGQSFSGYKLIETRKLNNHSLPHNHIPHSDKPTLNKIKNSNFVEFFNATNTNIFYDFGSPTIDAHKRSILFYLLYFKNEDGGEKVEIRHCSLTVKKFDVEKDDLKIEEKLSKEVEKYINENDNFIEGLKKFKQSKNVQ